MIQSELEISAEEIETALITPNDVLAQLHIALLKVCSIRSSLSLSLKYVFPCWNLFFGCLRGFVVMERVGMLICKFNDVPEAERISFRSSRKSGLTGGFGGF